MHGDCLPLASRPAIVDPRLHNFMGLLFISKELFGLFSSFDLAVKFAVNCLHGCFYCVPVLQWFFVYRTHYKSVLILHLLGWRLLLREFQRYKLFQFFGSVFLVLAHLDFVHVMDAVDELGELAWACPQVRRDLTPQWQLLRDFAFFLKVKEISEFLFNL